MILSKRTDGFMFRLPDSGMSHVCLENDVLLAKRLFHCGLCAIYGNESKPGAPNPARLNSVHFLWSTRVPSAMNHTQKSMY